MRKGEPVILLDDFVDILGPSLAPGCGRATGRSQTRKPPGIEVSQFTARVFAMMDDDDSGELVCCRVLFAGVWEWLH